MTCEARPLGGTTTGSGLEIEQYRLRAGTMTLDVVNVGGAITRLSVPDRTGQVANVVLGYDDLAEYAGPRREYFGAIIGRVGNRIAGGRFALQDREHQLATNDGPNHLHGGMRGFDRQPWRVVECSAADAACLRLELKSPDADEGYPGELYAIVTYTLAIGGELRIDYEAVAAAHTIVNMTHHDYFNLAGEGSGDVLAHELQIDADAFCAIDETLIPTGELQRVDGTAFDFREAACIGPALSRADRQLQLARGFDHCMALRHWDSTHRRSRKVCSLHDPGSGRRMSVHTDQPGMQFYTGNFLDGTAVGPGGIPYGIHAGLCLETQHFPDAPNQPGFPSIVLQAGERYSTSTVLRFDVLP
jgi:aldose 1-epimerase